MAEPSADIGSKLQAWLEGREVDALVEVTGRATVGLSQDTWFVRVTGADGAVEGVLAAAHALLRAAGDPHAGVALQAVAGRLPAPAVLWHDADADNPFGAPFLVMERIAGMVPVGWHDVPEPERTALAEQAVDGARGAARRRPRPAGLRGGRRRGRPTSRSTCGGSSASRRCRRSCPARCGGSSATPRRPRSRRSPTGTSAWANMIVDGDRLAGVLDWEMAGPGDPLADLAWCSIPLWEPSRVDEAALVRRYEQRTGAPVDADRLHWHRVLGYVRLAYYSLSGTRAFDRGHSDDFRLAALRLQLPVHLDRLTAALAGEAVTT